MERIRRGDIWTVSLPTFEKPRPALIVSIDPINDLRPDVLVVPITSQAGPLRVRLPDVDEGTGLRLDSYAKCEVVGPVHKSRLKRRIGQIPERAWPAVEAGLARVLGLPELDVSIGSPDPGGDTLD
jgi:mRNA-degrading endonuclease toxin of MazEF toxin-antitoxin module